MVLTYNIPSSSVLLLSYLINAQATPWPRALARIVRQIQRFLLIDQTFEHFHFVISNRLLMPRLWLEEGIGACNFRDGSCLRVSVQKLFYKESHLRTIRYL